MANEANQIIITVLLLEVGSKLNVEKQRQQRIECQKQRVLNERQVHESNGFYITVFCHEIYN